MEEKNFIENYSKIKNIVCNAYKAPYFKILIDNSGIDISKDFTYDDFRKIEYTTKNNYNDNKFDMFTNQLDGFTKENYDKFENGKTKQQFVRKYNLQFRITSGSTGQPLEVFKGMKDDKKDYIALNMHRRKLTNYEFNGVFMWIWPVNPYTVKFYNYTYSVNEPVHINKYGYQFFLFEHADENLRKLYDALINIKCEWVTSSPTALCSLINYIKKNDLSAPSLKYIECHSEKLYDWQREMITDAFGINPISIYSSNEVQFMGAVCECGNLHVFTNDCFVEFVDTVADVKELCVTSLNYKDVPIIRYKLGDCGEWAENQKCNCKLHKYPIINLKGYRVNDFLVTKNNTLVEPFVIADSIYYISNTFNVEIKQHKVVEKRFDLFEYYLDTSLFCSGISKVKDFLEYYLMVVLGYNITVEIMDFKSESSIYKGRKYKYFEVCIEK